MKKGEKGIAIGFVFLFLVVGLISWIAWGNTALQRSDVRIEKANLPAEFDGYTIAHISDLHNAEMGKDNEALLSMIETAAPDIIAVTGDLVDSRRTDLEVSIRFMERAVKIAPCYYVTGNHEASLTKEYPTLEKELSKVGVRVLRNEEITIEKGGEFISIIGLDDPNFSNLSPTEFIEKQLKDRDMSAFTVLLAHRPELFSTYANYDVDLVLCGHAHGGQFRIFNQGIFAPGQGMFPKYTQGVFTDGKTSMVVSRGIGNSAFPFRINNRPEVVIIQLSAV